METVKFESANNLLAHAYNLTHVCEQLQEKENFFKDLKADLETTHGTGYGYEPTLAKEYLANKKWRD